MGARERWLSLAPLQWRHRLRKILAWKLLLETRQPCLRCVPMWFRESKPGNNGNVAWQGLSTIHQQRAVTTCRGAKASRERERECRVVPEACG